VWCRERLRLFSKLSVFFPPGSSLISGEGRENGSARGGFESRQKYAIKSVISLWVLSELCVNGHNHPAPQHREVGGLFGLSHQFQKGGPGEQRKVSLLGAHGKGIQVVA
jgi:hypothetical protein